MNSLRMALLIFALASGGSSTRYRNSQASLAPNQNPHPPNSRPQPEHQSNLFQISLIPGAPVRVIGTKYVDKKLKNDLEIEVRNTSTKTVVFFTLKLEVPDQETCPALSYVAERLIVYGNPHSSTDGNPASDKMVTPGDSIKLKLTRKEYDEVDKARQRVKCNDAGKPILHLLNVGFSDGSTWGYNGRVFLRRRVLAAYSTGARVVLPFIFNSDDFGVGHAPG
jgi:hypothetical protein